MTQIRRAARAAAWVALIVGGGGVSLAFLAFLLGWPWLWLPYQAGTYVGLLWDAACVAALAKLWSVLHMRSVIRRQREAALEADSPDRGTA
jgi:hypothetical protein